ncbi:MAG: polyprenyl diphosphate synthase [Rhodobacteraceae bacterium]|nr:polyprenyl diphosphate synthase [Paracoccaceae bacterium]
MANSRAVRGTTSARHVAMIMDGNGRWAVERGQPRLLGHKRGVETVREIVKSCPDLGVTHLTMFAFSTENWKRSKTEVSGLMLLLRRYIQKEIADLIDKGIRLRFIGRKDRVEKGLRALMESAEKRTEHNNKLHLTIAIDYGGRDEMTRVMQGIAVDIAARKLTPADVSEALISSRLDTFDLPDPDLVIRTSGECRTSNFLLWQTAYAEYEFVDVNWPDFTPEIFGQMLENFMLRDRRFGAVAK